MTSGNSSPLRQTADGYFPVRIRMPGRPEGFSERLNTMHKWLHRRIGLKRFCQSGQPLDGLYFYFDDINIAREFVRHFECELIEISNKLPN